MVGDRPRTRAADLHIPLLAAGCISVTDNRDFLRATLVGEFGQPVQQRIGCCCDVRTGLMKTYRLRIQICESALAQCVN